MEADSLIKADLHIHSALSPCANNEMVPSKIIERAVKLGIDMIAITDHNSLGNVAAFLEAAEKTFSPEIIPGVEIQTSEEVHLICLFDSLETALYFENNFIKPYLPDRKNYRHMFGDQFLVNSQDKFVDIDERFLINSLDLSVDEIVKEVTKVGGLTIAAHVDRPSNSLLANLGFIPQDLELDALELSANSSLMKYVENMEFPDQCIIYSSDAHFLDDIGKGYISFEGNPDFPSLKEALKLKNISRVFHGGDG